MDGTQNIQKISVALLAAQKEVAKVLKGAENPFFKSKYADLTAVIDSIKGPLNKNGITFLQLIGHDAPDDFVETVLLHESGEYISTKTKVYCEKANSAQSFGSGITYAKRYALQAALGLPTEDDDGNAATPSQTKKKPAKKEAPKPEQAVDEAFDKYVTDNIDLLSNNVNMGFDKDLFVAEVKKRRNGKKSLSDIVAEIGVLDVMKEIEGG